MAGSDVVCKGQQTLLIVAVRTNIHKVIHYCTVFFLKHLAVLAKSFVSVIIVGTVFWNFINKKKRKDFYPQALLKKFFLFLKMAADCLTNLNAANVFFRDISSHFSNPKNSRVGIIAYGFIKANKILLRQNFCHINIFVFWQSFACFKEFVARGKLYWKPLYSAVLFYFNFKADNRSGMRRKYDWICINVSVCSRDVLQLKALYLYFLYQLLIVSVQSVQSIHKIMLNFMRGGIVDDKKRLELLQRFLCRRLCISHSLRFIKNQNRSVGGNHVNRAAACEFITFGIDNAGGFISFSAFDILVFIQRRIESLSVDNHCVYVRTRWKLVNHVQTLWIVDEEADFLSVMLHKVFLSIFKTLVNALADCDRRNYDNEFAPTVSLVQLVHGLCVNIGLTSSCFHFNIKTRFSCGMFNLLWADNKIIILNFMNVVQKLFFA